MAKTLKLSIDGRNLCGPMSGISRYVSQSILGLSSTGIDISVLHPMPIASQFRFLLDCPNVTFKQVKRCLNIPCYTDLNEDVFWGPAHRLPVNHPKRVPTVVTIHDLVWQHYRETMHKRTYLGEKLFFRGAVNRADRIVCVSKSTAHDLAQYNPILSDKIITIYPGANEPKKFPTGKKSFLLFVGTMEPRKNLNTLIDAYAALSEGLRNEVPLTIVGGNGWGRVNLKSYILDRGLEGNVRLITNANDEEINKLYAECYCLLMPSLYEGFGLPLVEAMKYGKPVITSNVSSMPEVAGNAGLLVNPKDTTSISYQIKRLITDKVLYSQLTENAQSRAKLFSWAASTDTLLSQFSKLVKRCKIEV